MDKNINAQEDARNKSNSRSEKLFGPKKQLPIKAGGVLEARKIQEDARIRLEAIERKRTRNRSIILAVSVLFIMGLTVAIVNLLLNRMTAKPSLQFLMVDEVSESYEARGVIARPEILLTSPITGIVRPMLPEAAKAGKKESVAMVLSPDMQLVYREWNNLTKDVSKRRLELIAQGQGTGTSGIFAETDSQLSPILDDLRKASSRQSLKNVSSQEISVNAMLYSRNLKLAKIDFSDDKLAAYMTNMDILDQQLKKDAVHLNATESGYLSYMSDGLERSLTTTRLENLSEVQLVNLLNQPESFQSLPANVEKGQTVCRISNGPDHDLAFLVRGLKADYFEGLKRISLYLPKENLLIENCKILKLSDSSTGTLLICRSDSCVEELLDRRILDGRIIVRRSYGFKVPLAALSDYNYETQLAKLMIVRAGATKFIDVKIKAKDDRYAVLEEVNTDKPLLIEGSIYIENPHEIREGTNIE